MTRTEGNVIHANFRKPSFLPQMSFTCQVLYQDEHAKLIRMIYRIDGREFIQHIASGVGLDV